MPPKVLAFSALAAALMVSGCSSSGSAPSSPLNYSAVAVQSGGGTSTTSGSISGSPQNATVRVGGTTYTFGGATYEGNTSGIDTYRYSSGNRIDPNGAALNVGQYARAALIADNVNGQAAFVVDGTETRYSDMPNQSANYDGLWSISDAAGGQAAGTFEAGVNFDSRAIGFELYDQSGLVGGGNGRVQGTGFTSTLDTRNAQDQGPVGGSFDSNNRVDGQFYGPRAAEMAGLISGSTTSGDSTGGALIGTKR